MSESNEISDTIKFILSGRRYPSSGQLPRTAPDFVLDDVLALIPEPSQGAWLPTLIEP
jgi:hypothetical protein